MLKQIVTFVIAALLVSAGVAVAQDTTLPPVDPTGWGTSPFVFGGFLFLVLAALKRAVEQRNFTKYGYITGNPWLWRALALALGVGGAFGLNIAKFGAELLVFGLVSPWSVLAFGLASSVVAMGYRDALKSALGWIGGPALPGIAAPAPDPQPAGPALPSGFEPLPFAAPGAFSLAGLTPLSIEAIVELLLGQLGLPATPTNLLRIGARLAVAAPDLLDGNSHLSAENRARILNVIIDLKVQGGLTK